MGWFKRLVGKAAATTARVIGKAVQVGKKVVGHPLFKHFAPEILNTAISHLPNELHVPGYHYLGPGTKFEERQYGEFGKTRDSKGRLNKDPINSLDAAAMEHDKAYATYPDVKRRAESDLVLRRKAQDIARDSSKSWSERIPAYATDKIFQLKNHYDTES